MFDDINFPTDDRPARNNQPRTGAIQQNSNSGRTWLRIELSQMELEWIEVVFVYPINHFHLLALMLSCPSCPALIVSWQLLGSKGILIHDVFDLRMNITGLPAECSAESTNLFVYSIHRHPFRYRKWCIENTGSIFDGVISEKICTHLNTH